MGCIGDSVFAPYIRFRHLQPAQPSQEPTPNPAPFFQSQDEPKQLAGFFYQHPNSKLPEPGQYPYMKYPAPPPNPDTVPWNYRSLYPDLPEDEPEELRRIVREDDSRLVKKSMEDMFEDPYLNIGRPECMRSPYLQDVPPSCGSFPPNLYPRRNYRHCYGIGHKRYRRSINDSFPSLDSLKEIAVDTPVVSPSTSLETSLFKNISDVEAITLTTVEPGISSTASVDISSKSTGQMVVSTGKMKSSKPMGKHQFYHFLGSKFVVLSGRSIRQNTNGTFKVVFFRNNTLDQRSVKKPETRPSKKRSFCTFTSLFRFSKSLAKGKHNRAHKGGGRSSAKGKHKKLSQECESTGEHSQSRNQSCQYFIFYGSVALDGSIIPCEDSKPGASDKYVKKTAVKSKKKVKGKDFSSTKSFNGVPLFILFNDTVLCRNDLKQNDTIQKMFFPNLENSCIDNPDALDTFISNFCGETEVSITSSYLRPSSSNITDKLGKFFKINHPSDVTTTLSSNSDGSGTESSNIEKSNSTEDTLRISPANEFHYVLEPNHPSIGEYERFIFPNGTVLLGGDLVRRANYDYSKFLQLLEPGVKRKVKEKGFEREVPFPIDEMTTRSTFHEFDMPLSGKIEYDFTFKHKTSPVPEMFGSGWEKPPAPYGVVRILSSDDSHSQGVQVSNSLSSVKNSTKYSFYSMFDVESTSISPVEDDSSASSVTSDTDTVSASQPVSTNPCNDSESTTPFGAVRDETTFKPKQTDTSSIMPVNTTICPTDNSTYNSTYNCTGSSTDASPMRTETAIVSGALPNITTESLDATTCKDLSTSVTPVSTIFQPTNQVFTNGSGKPLLVPLVIAKNGKVWTLEDFLEENPVLKANRIEPPDVYVYLHNDETPIAASQYLLLKNGTMMSKWDMLVKSGFTYSNFLELCLMTGAQTIVMEDQILLKPPHLSSFREKDLIALTKFPSKGVPDEVTQPLVCLRDDMDNELFSTQETFLSNGFHRAVLNSKRINPPDDDYIDMTTHQDMRHHRYRSSVHASRKSKFMPTSPPDQHFFPATTKEYKARKLDPLAAEDLFEHKMPYHPRGHSASKRINR